MPTPSPLPNLNLKEVAHHLTSWQGFRSWIQGILHPTSSPPSCHVPCPQRQQLSAAICKPYCINQGSSASIRRAHPHHPLAVTALMWADWATETDATPGTHLCTFRSQHSPDRMPAQPVGPGSPCALPGEPAEALRTREAEYLMRTESGEPS